MSTESQRVEFQLWAEDTKFVLDLDASPKREFARLAKIRGWVGGDEQWNIHWLLLFGEEYRYICRQHASPPPATLITFVQTPEYAMPPESDLKQEFFYVCHNRSLQVGTKKWRRCWNECFLQPWTSCGFACSYQATGPASELQQLCFGVFDNFSLAKDADVAQEFARLVKEKEWNHSKAMEEKRWCFGAYISPKFCIVDSGSDSDWDLVSNSNTDSSRSTYSISDAGGVTIDVRPCPTTELATEFKGLSIRQSLPRKCKLLASPAQHAPPAASSIPFKQQATSQNNSSKGKQPPTIHNHSSMSKQPVTSQDNSGKSKRQRRAEALGNDFCNFFGSDMNQLQGLQNLCNIVGISPDLKSVTQCKKALKSVHINLVNLVQHCRNPGTTQLIKFASQKEFRDYTLGANKSRIFPKAMAKQNTLLKALLERIF